MKILHILYESKGDYFGIGGVGIRAYNIYSYLKDRHDITLLCKKYPGARNGEIEGLKHIFVGTESKSLTKTLLSYAYHAAFFVKRHGDGFDIIIEEFSPAIPTFLHAFTKKPIVLQVQGYTGRLYFKKYNPVYSVALNLMEQFRPKFYRNLIYVNPETSKNFKLRRDAYVKFISNGVSPELFKATASERNYILYIGRIDIYGKGLDVLINAYKEFYKSFPDIGLFIAGDGRDMNEFKNMLMDLPEDMRKKVELAGWVSGKKKKEIIRNALFVVFPSRHDVQSISVLEAMACEKAIIVSDIPEFGYLVNNGAAISFKTGDAISLARSMKALVASKERKVMGQRGRNLIGDLTWDRISLLFERFIEEIVVQEKEGRIKKEL